MTAQLALIIFLRPLPARIFTAEVATSPNDILDLTEENVEKVNPKGTMHVTGMINILHMLHMILDYRYLSPCTSLFLAEYQCALCRFWMRSGLT